MVLALFLQQSYKNNYLTFNISSSDLFSCFFRLTKYEKITVSFTNTVQLFYYFYLYSFQWKFHFYSSQRNLVANTCHISQPFIFSLLKINETRPNSKQLLIFDSDLCKWPSGDRAIFDANALAKSARKFHPIRCKHALTHWNRNSLKIGQFKCFYG